MKKKEYKQSCEEIEKGNWNASAVNRTRGPSMATMDFTTKPLMLLGLIGGIQKCINYTITQVQK
jgi:hypothetical protein